MSIKYQWGGVKVNIGVKVNKNDIMIDYWCLPSSALDGKQYSRWLFKPVRLPFGPAAHNALQPLE